MDIHGWIELSAFVIALLAITKPLGLHLCRVLDPSGRTFLDPVVGPLERSIYRLLGIDRRKEQEWMGYAASMIALSLVTMLLTYAILRFQGSLPLNPQGLPAVGGHLAFNTAASFTTNTNWQSYGGESTLSYLSQMFGLTLHQFLSAAVGISVAAALVRGIARDGARTVGNFWVDLVRVVLHLLLPLCLVYAVFLVSQGMIQNFCPGTRAALLDPAAGADGAAVQVIAQGPMASQVAIKMLGTNGGGFMNANAAHPFENPTPLSNFIQILSIFAIPAGLTWYLGREVRSQGHGWAVWSAMTSLFLAGVLVVWSAEAAGNPRIAALGVDPSGGNMEGKEVRFGIFDSALFATVTTDASCGAVNSMHDSFTPLGGLVPLSNILLGEVVFGGVGSGLYGMLVFVVIAVFIAGLLVGKTPEYLGKKIEAFEVKAAVLAILAPVFCILGLSAVAVSTDWGISSLGNGGPHGFGEILYAFASGAGNNGSAFAGLNANTPWYDVLLALDMMLGRFFVIIPVLALAGSLARKKLAPLGGGSFPVWGPTFTVLLIGTIVIVGGLTFLPALALGPIVEHFLMAGSEATF